MNKTIKALFGSIEETKELYEPLLTCDDYDELLEKAYNGANLTYDQRAELCDIFGEYFCVTEQHGFEQGLKLGLKLGFAACNDEDKGA